MCQKSVIILILFVLIGIAPVAAFYADVYVKVDDTGRTTTEGIANSEILTDGSHLFTSKSQNIWTVNITDLTFYDTLTYEIRLPKHSAVTFLESSTAARMIVEEGHPTIVGNGVNDSLRIIIQYELRERKTSNTIYYVAGIVFFIILSTLGVYFAKKKPKKLSSKLDGRQGDIVAMLENNGQMTAKQINETLKLPKSSLSRNVNSLVRQGIITKKQNGMSYILEVVKSDEKKK